jgi:hypothetical protein
VPEGAILKAKNAERAEELMEIEHPEANITWIVQTNDINHAFDVYHNESSLETH